MSYIVDATMPITYVIYRECGYSAEGQPMDLTAPLAFCPPKDSDELFDLLRAKYPNFKSHSERMRQAVIDFLMEEQMTDALVDSTSQSPFEPQDLQLSTDQFSQISTDFQQLQTPQTCQSANVSPWEASLQSMSSDASTWSSPEMLDLGTPSFDISPQQSQAPQAPQRQYSVAASATTSDQSPPAIEQMTGVFCLSDSTQPKQRVRRKMTEAEKIEYRKRRQVKACEKCAKRKRKCHHNQSEMEVLAASKVTKQTSSSQTSRATPQHQQQQLQIQQLTTGLDSGMSGFEFMPDAAMPSFGDFTMLPGDSLPLEDLDNLFMTNNEEWPYGEVDQTLLDFHCGNGVQKSDLGHEPDIFRTSGDDIGLPLQQTVRQQTARQQMPLQLQQMPPQQTPLQQTTGLLAGEGPLQWEQPRVPGGTPSQSLGAGVKTRSDIATELYRLKRSTLSRTTTTALNPLNPLLLTIPDDKAAPVHTRTRNPGASGQNSNAELELAAVRWGESATTSTSYSTPSESAIVNYRLFSDGANIAPSARPASGLAASTTRQNEVASFMLEDHVRRRDHFGRSLLSLAASTATIIGAMGMLLWLFSFVPSATFSIPSMVWLALVIPHSDLGDGRIHTSRTPFKQLWGVDWQWLIWNSSWSDTEGKGSAEAQPERCLYRQVLDVSGRAASDAGAHKMHETRMACS